jgi:predicted NBD/HSP70 family sugar kinase
MKSLIASNPGSSLMSLSTSIRAINRARIIALIRRNSGLTRVDVSRISGLSKGTVSNHITELLNEGLLYEDSEKRQRKTGLFLNRKAGVAVGIELSPNECRGVVTDMGIKPLKRFRHPLNSTSVEETIETILLTIEALLSEVDEKCVGLVIGVPGPTDPPGQILAFSESLGWSDVPLAQKLEKRLPYRVTLINRARAGTLGEHWYGAGVDVEDLIYVTVSSGIAAGLLIGGQLYTGAYNNNGELGHTTIIPDGKSCVCGNHGCLETVASMPAIISSIQSRLHNGEPSILDQRPLNYQDVIAAAREGDVVVLDEIKKAGRYLGIAVANLINLFNPQLVIVGGQLAEVGEGVVRTIQNTAQRKSFPVSFAGVKIVKSALGPDSVCIGASALAVDQYIAALVE